MLDNKFWKKYFSVYDYLSELIPYNDLLDKIVDLLEIKDNDKVFDAGSGTGNLSLKISKKANTEITAMDFSYEGILLHKKKQDKVNILHGDLTNKLPFGDNTFDKLCSNNVIYTLPVSCRQEVFNEFYRVLKPNGIIVISNISQKFNARKIYFSHVNSLIKNIGIIATLKKVIKLVIPTLKIFYYNYLIKKENDKLMFQFVSENDQLNYLRKSGFKNISPNITVYAGQAILNSAVK